MIGRKDWELQQATLKHNCCGSRGNDSESGNSGKDDNNNILILNNEDYQDALSASITNPPFFTIEDIDYESEEDLTITIFELDETDINSITNSINNIGYIPITIGVTCENTLFIDKFEDLNHHYKQDDNMLQDVKIHIHKTAVMLPITNKGGR